MVLWQLDLAPGGARGGLGQERIDCMSPVNRKYTSYYSFHINDHYSVFFSVMKWFLWSSIPPSISKHLASRPWRTRYPGPERMISSRIPPNLCWTLVKKIRQKFRFNSISNFSPAIRRRNKVFWFPGLIFSTTPSLFKRELPENARFRCQFRPLRAQNTKKIPKK